MWITRKPSLGLQHQAAIPAHSKHQDLPAEVNANVSQRGVGEVEGLARAARVCCLAMVKGELRLVFTVLLLPKSHGCLRR